MKWMLIWVQICVANKAAMTLKQIFIQKHKLEILTMKNIKAI